MHHSIFLNDQSDFLRVYDQFAAKKLSSPIITYTLMLTPLNLEAVSECILLLPPFRPERKHTCPGKSLKTLT